MQAANDILHAFLQVSRKMTEELRGHCGKLNLTFPQTLVLTLLDSDGPMPISALAKATGSANSTISGVIDRLEKVELVRRVRSEQDRRVIYVDVTDKYREIEAEQKSHAMTRFAQCISDMTPEEKAQVLDALLLLNDAMYHKKGTEQETNL
ncbi:MAG: MarR family transcriptional regulator [Oscillospiraceae bacterium]|nr:MarR family transcriptional regulator [Oscillospiraceae bacterium]